VIAAGPATGSLAALAGPRLFDVVLGATLLEAILLLVLGRRLGLAPRRWLPFVAAGAGLALAGRLSSGGASTAAVGGALVLAFVFQAWHLAQLAERRGPGSS
jgi:hypothetical protein